jgi:hypothetical protein
MIKSVCKAISKIYKQGESGKISKIALKQKFFSVLIEIKTFARFIVFYRPVEML